MKMLDRHGGKLQVWKKQKGHTPAFSCFPIFEDLIRRSGVRVISNAPEIPLAKPRQALWKGWWQGCSCNLNFVQIF